MFSGRVQARDLDQEVVQDRKNRKNLRAEKKAVPYRTAQKTATRICFSRN